MANLDLMNALVVSAVRFVPDWGQEISSQANGVIRVADLRPTLWRARMTCGLLTNAQGKQIEALLGSYAGSMTSFYLWNPKARYPQADPIGEMLGASVVRINSLNVDNKSLSLKGLPITLGPELVADLSSGAGTNWTYDSPNAEWDKTPGAANVLTINIPDLDAGATYKLVWTMANRTASNATPQLSGGSTVVGTQRSSNGTYTDYLVAASGNTNLQFVPGSTFDGSVKAVSLKKVTAFYTITRGDFLSFDYGAGPSRALHQVVTASTVASALGVTAEFEVHPHIRTGAAEDIVVTLAKPAGEFRLVPGTFDPSTVGLTSSLTLEAVQVL